MARIILISARWGIRNTSRGWRALWVSVIKRKNVHRKRTLLSKRLPHLPSHNELPVGDVSDATGKTNEEVLSQAGGNDKDVNIWAGRIRPRLVVSLMRAVIIIPGSP